MNIVELLIVSAEATDQRMSSAAAALIERDVSEYPANWVERAIEVLRKKGQRITTANLLSVMKSADGRPSADEAWSVVPKSEAEAGVVNDEIMAAWGVAYELYESGDRIGAKLAFNREYAMNVEAARDAGIATNWWLTCGTDKQQIEDAAQKGFDCGRLTADVAMKYLPQVDPKIARIKLAPGKADENKLKLQHIAARIVDKSRGEG